MPAKNQQDDIPEGIVKDNDYATRDDKNPIPVVPDDVPVEDPYDPTTADSSKQLERDEKDAIDRRNIINERTRGAAKKPGTYIEPGDEEGLPGPDDGRSSIRQ
ncbi:hypothetical protein DM02DRAFT_623426 [Periconia macrospinosa]|uniref:Histone chaperone domain-containing protein n=1 Tax=Periconia macrospinosa TaxID=97972 RepID=A0A2V1E8Z3_9PLEO|nr:hypothetical protein DM02DRAFT_623426 [Periconia macrospinosa]